jgi:hypothetical protein
MRVFSSEPVSKSGWFWNGFLSKEKQGNSETRPGFPELPGMGKRPKKSFSAGNKRHFLKTGLLFVLRV